MLGSAEVLPLFVECGYRFFCGVPCSYLTPLMNAVISDKSLRYVGATSEGEAVAIAVGASLAGRKSMVLCQNSGLGNAVNPLTSLAHPFRIPFLLLTTWRGENAQTAEPQHFFMGRITSDLLTVLSIPHQLFPHDCEGLRAVLKQADHHYEKERMPYGIIMRQGTMRDEGLVEPPLPQSTEDGVLQDLRSSQQQQTTRFKALQTIRQSVAEDVPMIATTGKCGRELYSLGDHDGHFYQVGAMGCASGVALGVALHSKKHIVVLDGDGAALMKLGSFATIGAYQPARYTHILLDNHCHDSTGGQKTVAEHVDFCRIALACGYRAAYRCNDTSGLAQAYQQRHAIEGPVLIHMRIQAGSKSPLGRPAIAADKLADRFKAFLGRA